MWAGCWGRREEVQLSCGIGVAAVNELPPALVIHCIISRCLASCMVRDLKPPKQTQYTQGTTS